MCLIARLTSKRGIIRGSSSFYVRLTTYLLKPVLSMMFKTVLRDTTLSCKVPSMAI
jgi:hypothetical protein